MMDVPRRNLDVHCSGYNLQMNESERCQVPSQTAGKTRNYIPSQVLSHTAGKPRNYIPSQVSSQVPSSMQNQVLKNQVQTQVLGSAVNKALSPFPNSYAPGQAAIGHLPISTACTPQNHAFRNNVSVETRRCVQATTKTPNQDHPTTAFLSVYRESLPACDKFGQQAGEAVVAGQSNRVEGACGFRTIGDHQKVPNVRNTVTQIGLSERASNNVYYINPQLVQKVLECQKKRAQTPTSNLCNSIKEVPLVGLSAGQRISRFKKPEHHSSDVSLSNKMADCRITDPETVSTGSQKESGYQSGDSVGDRSSENSELCRIMRWPTSPSIAKPYPEFPGTPDGQCEQYFLKGDSLMDLCSEQEYSGNWQKALNFLNQAIDYFQQAVNVPGASHENLLRMRLKHNRAVLHWRKLMKQVGSSSTEPTNRRLPCPPQEVKGRSSTDMFSQHHQPIIDRHNIVPIGMECVGNTWKEGYRMEHSVYPDDGSGKFICTSNRNGGNISSIAGNPCLPETGLQWTSNDVKDIKIYATLPKNRSRKGPLVTDTPKHNPVQNESQTEISVSYRNQESRHQSEVVNQRKDPTEHQASELRKYQQVPTSFGTSGMMLSREPEPQALPVEGKFLVPNRVGQMPYSDGQWTHDSLSHNFGSQNVNISKTAGSASDPMKLVRF